MEMRVSNQTKTLDLAAAITGVVTDAIEKEQPLELFLVCIGMQSTNKAVAAACNMINMSAKTKEDYIYISIVPFFEKVVTASKPGLEVNRMKLKVIIL